MPFVTAVRRNVSAYTDTRRANRSERRFGMSVPTLPALAEHRLSTGRLPRTAAFAMRLLGRTGSDSTFGSRTLGRIAVLVRNATLDPQCDRDLLALESGFLRFAGSLARQNSDTKVCVSLKVLAQKADTINEVD